jgi:hypothetical protein
LKQFRGLNNFFANMRNVVSFSAKTKNFTNVGQFFKNVLENAAKK